ncbi:hypothetical protein B0T14DRAFT_424511 [Immersiella caudata]|uniref:Rhodopsin domain-containing protein n=1 Tax=Immersiella caudata TaxID=314043 RepID=A0AA39X5X0_9PEZI|nr:hypothetical protein B0T14DRAFT_424511 [Immersiella caudata]
MAVAKRDPALDGESRTGEVVAILTIASAVSTLAVLLRCYCRHVLLRSFGWDDGVMVAAQILTIAAAVAIGLETKWGLGQHVWTMSKEHFTPYMKASNTAKGSLSIVVYNIAVCLTKISIVLQYRRIFVHTLLRPITLSFLVLLSAWAITLSVMLPLVCTPVESFWNRAVPGRCMNFKTLWYIVSGVNMATDFALFIMPIPVVSSLHLPRRQKMILLAIFGLGIFPCAISIYRIQTLEAAASAKDPTWDNVDAAIFSFLELTVGVVAVCLPTLRPLVAATMPRLLGSLRPQKHSHVAEPGDCMPTPNVVAFSLGSKTSTLRGSRSEEIEEGKNCVLARERSKGSEVDVECVDGLGPSVESKQAP